MKFRKNKVTGSYTSEEANGRHGLITPVSDGWRVWVSAHRNGITKEPFVLGVYKTLKEAKSEVTWILS